ncbi:uncharacterized protein LOC118420791 isoform X2 [Branchiostoma floridae]|uniref:Uncharacterized protein LOC118420791 isoform X2 n=1 Tax=Branchiostoma floridae TaxID=7739 RepID=A0A9J7LKX8_BRAFL|nr:uncharacterized protein LOC118420791 isoform X2 [Branchiostoma floridae]
MASCNSETNTSCPESRPKKKNFSTGKYCKAYGCKSSNYIQVDGETVLSNISFFSVPKKVLDNKKKLKHWASLIKRDISALTSNQSSVVCEKHFEDSDILRWSGHGLRLKTPKLREGALPVLHSWVTVKPKRPAPKQRCWPPPKKLKGPKSKKITASEVGSSVNNSANGSAPDLHTTMDASGSGLDQELDDHHNYAIRLRHDSRLEGDNARLNSVVTPMCAHLSSSVQGGGEDFHGASDHVSEGDRNPPMTGILGFSKETTLALLPRMKVEELQSELNRRNIVVAAGYRARRKGDLEHVLREVMTKEYEAEEDEGMDMIMSNTSPTFEHGCSNTSPTFEHGCSDTSPTFEHGCSDTSPSFENGCSNTSPTFEHGCSDTSSAFEHGHWLEMGDGSQVPSAPNNDQTTLQNVRELPQEHTEKEETSSWQATDMDVSETPSTDTSLRQIQVKKEPMELLEFEQYTYSAVGVTEPLTSLTQHLGTVLGSQPNSVSSQDPMVRIKTEPGVEEETEDEQQNLRSEPCPSSLGQLSQEQVKVEVSTEEDDQPSSSSKEPEKAVHVMLTRPIKCRVPAWSSDEIRALLKFLSLPSEGWDPTQSTGWPKMRSQHPLWSKAAQFVQENSRSSILRTVGAVQTQVSKHLNSLYPLSAGGRLAAEKAMGISEQESRTSPRSPEPIRRYMDAGAQTEEQFLKPHLPVIQETSAPVPQGISIPEPNGC